MSLWTKILGRFGITPRPPLPREVLGAHINALIERQKRDEAAAQDAKGGAARRLAVVPAAGHLRVRVEVGLSSAEILPDSGSLRVSIGADHFLVDSGGLSAERHQLMQEFGFSRPPGSGEFLAEYTAASPRALDAAVTRIDVLLSELFQLTSDSSYSISIERAPERRNDSLLSSIRTLVKRKDFESRRLLYQEVVNAWLYVPLVAEGESEYAPKVARYDDGENGSAVWPVFTDLEALGEYRSETPPHALVSGIRLVQAARSHQLGGLKINPGSNVGGELLGNELETLADYLDSVGLMKA